MHSPPTGHHALRNLSFTGGAALLLLLAEINGAALRLTALDGVSTNAQFGLLVAGIGLVTYGLDGFRWPALTRREWLAAGALTALALVIRAWAVDSSIRALVDELNFTRAIQTAWSDPNVKLLVPFSDITAFPFLFPYWQSWAVDIFGRNFVGLRAVSVLLGALTVPALYLLARTLFDRPAALAAGVLLAALPPHINFSRIGINNIADPLFGTLALAYLARGIQHGRRGDYALGGALLGLTQYFYEGGRLLFPLLVTAWVVAVLLISRRLPEAEGVPVSQEWRGLRSADGRRGLLVFALAAGLVALPVYYTLAARGASAAERLNTELVMPTASYWPQIFTPDGLRQHLEEHLLAAFRVYFDQPDTTLFYAGNTALLLPALVPAFVLGVLHALRRWRQPGWLLLLLWVAAASLGNSFLLDSRQSPRYVVVLPALALLAAVGLHHTLRWLVRVRWLALALLGTVVAGLAVYQVNYYFNDHLPAYNRYFRAVLDYRDGQDAVLRGLAYPPGTRLHIISRRPLPEDYITGLLAFMTDSLQVDFFYSDTISVETFQHLTVGADHIFFVEPDDVDVIVLLHERFFLRPPAYSPYGLLLSEQFALYEAPYVPGLSEQRLMREG